MTGLFEPRISLCMIVWNEATTVERTVKSVASIVSEVVVGIDVNSNDGTREVLERVLKEIGVKNSFLNIRLSDELAAKRSLDGDDDWGFSKARNTVFDAADPEAWRIVLDGHEIVKDAEMFVAEIVEAAAAAVDGVDVRVWFEPADDGIPQTVFESTRAMAPHVRYVNPQHNIAKISSRRVASDVIIEHRKRDQAVTARAARNVQRSDSNIGGFENAVLKEPSNARAWFYLATAYKENSRYKEAVQAFDECLQHSRWNEERWHARVDKGHCLVFLDRLQDARDSYSMAIDEQRERAEAYYYLGDLAYKQERFGEAAVWLEMCVSMPMPACRLFLNPRVYMVMRHDALSMVYHHLRKYDLAIQQAEIAMTASPNPRIAKNIKLWRDWTNGVEAA